MVSNTVENIAIGAGSAAATYAAVEAWRRASERTVLDGKTVRSTRVDAARLSADADTFQFKSGGDRSGVTDRLAGVKTWNAAAAGKVMVYEYADGRQVIADGHQRTGLAKRLMGDGHAPIKMDALVLREADGWSPRDVRAYAAIKNMHESSGNALDMAKIMRERPDLVTSSLPMSDAKVREASALSRLSDKAFGMVVGGGVEPGAAAAVGEAVKDATRHADMIAEMSEAKVRGAQHARLYVQQALSAPSVAETTSSLFGEETHTRSLIKERSAVLDRALTSLKSNRKLFGMLEREADTIEAAGNKLARQANSSNADTAGRLSALVEKLATQRGNVSKMLDDAARAVASGEPAAKAGRAFLKSVQGAMEQGGIRALVGDAPLPMAASGGMQRMVAKTVQVPGEISQYVVDTDTGTVKQIKTSRGSGSSIVQDISGTPKGRAVLEYTKKQGGGSSGGMQRMVEKPTWSQRAREIGGDVLDRISALSPKDQKRVVAEYTGVHAKSAKEALKVLDNRLGGWEADSYTHVATNNNEGTAEPLRANRMREETRARLAGIVDQKVGSSSLTGQSSFIPPATTQEQVSAAIKSAGKPAVAQLPADDGLFGSSMNQTDLVDMAKAKQPGAYGTPEYQPPGQRVQNESYWASRAERPPTVNELPPGAFKGTQQEFSSLSPGMRREIERSALANVKIVQDKWLADRGITSLDQVKSMTQPERENLAREWEKISKPIDRKGPAGWSDEARAASAESRAAKALTPDDAAGRGRSRALDDLRRGAAVDLKQTKKAANAAFRAYSKAKTAESYAAFFEADGYHRELASNVGAAKATAKAEPRGMDGLTRSERNAAAGKVAKPAKPVAQAADGASMLEKFRATYEKTLAEQVKANPGKYAYGIDRVPDMARRMTDALASGGGDTTSPTVQAVAKALNIKPTVGGIRAALNDQPPPAPRPQKSPLEKAAAAHVKAEAERTRAWKQMQSGVIQGPQYADISRKAEAAKKAFEALKHGGEVSPRKANHAAEMAAIHQEIRDTLGPRGDGKHFHTDGTPITKESMAARGQAAPVTDSPERAAERQRIADGTKRIGDTFKAPAPPAPTKADAYAKGLTPMASAKAKAALDMQVRHNGKEFLTRAALVERAVADGAVVKTMKIAGRDERVLMGKDGSFLDTRNITKAGLDYAEHLSKQAAPVGWSDAAREAAAEARGVAKPGEAKPVKPAKAKASAKAAAPKAAKVKAPKPSAPEVQGPPQYREVINRRNGIQHGTKMVRVGPKAPKAAPASPTAALTDAAKSAGIKDPNATFAEMFKKGGKKTLGILGPAAIIGAGAVAFDATRNQAHAAGKSESAANLDAAGAAAIASGSVAAIGYGIGKVVQAAARVAPVAGKVLSRAVPLAALGAAAYEIGGGAIAGFKKDGLAGAAKGAGVGAMDFATLGAYSHFANKGQMGRLTPEQESQFASADQGYRAGQEQQKAAAATTDDSSGWTDQARIAAYMKRIANAGGTPQNMPYGGKPRQQPASSGTWAQSSVSVPSGAKKNGGGT